MTKVEVATAVEPGRWFVDPRLSTDVEAWHRAVGAIRRSSPVLPVSVEGYEPFWALTRYADILAVSRDNTTWHNTSRSVVQPDADYQAMLAAGIPAPRTLVHLDGTDHRDHRAVAHDWFKPAAVRHRQPRIDALVDLFVDRLRQLGGECDFARDIAQPFTLRVIMDIYGVPETDEPLMLELTQGLFGAADPEFMGTGEDASTTMIDSIMKFIEYFGAITEDRRSHPTEDLATVIATGEPGGCPMGDAERLWYYIIVATAGHDTTSFALSGGLEAMIRDPGQLWALRDEPELAANAADEAVRWTTPVRHFMRYATTDTEIGGVAIGEGERVMLSYPSANRDEAVWTDGDSFDIRRPNADKLLSYGQGAHFCLGAQVARREVRSLLARLATELTSLEAAGPAEWSQSNFVSGVKHLPIRYRFA